MKARWVVRGLKIAAIAIVAVTVFGFILMSLWNWLAPAVFGARTITFWRHRMRERWARMTPEERERFRRGMRNRCGHAGVAAEDLEGERA